MKRLLTILICLSLIFTMTAVMTGCGSEEAEITEPDPAEEPAAEPEAETDADADAEAETETEPEEEATNENVFTFSTETFTGDPFSSDDVKDAKLVMINFWEPWCGPCVGEMPDLERVYEEHKDEGFVILGVFSDTTMDDDAAKILEDAGITYPILRYTSEFDGFQTGYVPTTVFMTGEGKLLANDPVIGSQSYDTWNTAVKGILEGLKG